VVADFFIYIAFLRKEKFDKYFYACKKITEMRLMQNSDFSVFSGEKKVKLVLSRLQELIEVMMARFRR